MRHGAALILLSLAGTAAAQDHVQRGAMLWDGTVAPRGEALMQTALLSAHNDARKAQGLTPLAWDRSLAIDAARYARTLSARGEIAHDSQADAIDRQGENLFMGTRGAYSYADMAQLWVDEGRLFRKGVFPNVTTSGHWSRVSHYTQIVWPETQRVGCAIASNGRDDVLVCRYFPAGNVYGFALR